MGTLNGSVLVVEDDVAVGKVLTALLAQQGLEAIHLPTAESAIAALNRRPFDVVITDVRMPGLDGMQLLSFITQQHSGTPVIILTAHGSVPLAVEAMRRGAADFLLKPFDRDELVHVISKALIASAREQDKGAPVGNDSSLIGSSAGMQRVRALIRKAAPATATVLVLGETGTGKELVARALHEMSPRGREPLVRVNCAALPEALLESELFGHEKGAFTGAVSRRAGRVELAQRGTLFLDEIGDIPLPMQVKLLRVLQEREFERVGGMQTVKVDIRVIAATHRDLEAMIHAGTFREDLFYRLNVLSIRVPPLRERLEDIGALAHHFCTAFGTANARPSIRIDDGAVRQLTSHPWPGNVRQLQNLLERLVILCEGDTIRQSDVERELGSTETNPSLLEGTGAAADPSLLAQRRSAERDALLKALTLAKNNRTLAARHLNVSRRTLYNKLKEHGLE